MGISGDCQTSRFRAYQLACGDHCRSCARGRGRISESDWQGKEKKKEEEPEDGYKLNTYRHAQRSGPQYYALATQYLEAEFPLMPTA